MRKCNACGGTCRLAVPQRDCLQRMHESTLWEKELAFRQLPHRGRMARLQQYQSSKTLLTSLNSHPNPHSTFGPGGVKGRATIKGRRDGQGQGRVTQLKSTFPSCRSARVPCLSWAREGEMLQTECLFLLELDFWVFNEVLLTPENNW